MRTRRAATMLGAAVLLAAAGLAHPSAAAPLPELPLTCGMSISQSFRASTDTPANCTSGLIITRNNITVDLNGHTVDGDGVAVFGIATADSEIPIRNVRLRNGLVKDFATGVFIARGNGHLVERMKVTGNGKGMHVTGSFGSRSAGVVIRDNVVFKNSNNGIESAYLARSSITRNVVAGNGFDGIQIGTGTSGLQVRRNVVSMNSRIGMYLNGADRTVVAGNTILQNADHGIEYFVGRSVSITGNQVHRNTGVGIHPHSVKRARITRNTAFGNGGNGIYTSESPGVVVSGNTAGGVEDPGGIGILVASTSPRAKVIGNRTEANAATGITVLAPRSTVVGNVAHANVAVGIEVTGANSVVRGNVGRGVSAGCNQAGACRSNIRKGGTELPLKTVVCGENITRSIRVRNNLGSCPDVGLVANKAGITIDLNGKTITGSGTSFGVLLNAPRTRVLGGVVTMFDHGVVANAADVTASKVFAVGNDSYGILVSNGASGARIINNLAVANLHGGIGFNNDIGAINPVGGTVTRNVVVANGPGIQIESRAPTPPVITDNNVVVGVTGSGGIVVTNATSPINVLRNRVVGADSDGILVGGTTTAMIVDNNYAASNANGIRAIGPPSIRIQGNTTLASDIDGIDTSTGNGVIVNDGGQQGQVLGNTTLGNDTTGINVFDTVNTVAVGNAAHGNGHYGITLAGGGNRAYDNAAHGNGYDLPGTGPGVRLQAGSPGPSDFNLIFGNEVDTCTGSTPPTACDSTPF